MKCLICKTGKTRRGRATITLERGGAVVVVKNVPARICANCGEEYVDSKTTEAVFKSAEKAVRGGVHVDVRNYAVA